MSIVGAECSTTAQVVPLVVTPRRVQQVTLPATYLSGELPVQERRSATGLVRVRERAFIRDPGDVPAWQRARDTALGRCVAVARSLTCEHVLSHAGAALLHGCGVWSLPSAVDVVQPVHPSAGRTRDLRRHIGTVPAEEVTRVQGIRVTTLARTILDCARTLHPRDGLVVADSGLRLLVDAHRWDPAEAAERTAEVRAAMLARLDAPDMARGRRRARAVIELADPLAESPGETVLRWIAAAHGMPLPTLQYAIDTTRGRVYGDLAWRFRVGDRRVVIVAEYDGVAKYGEDAEAVIAEKVREDAIRETGAFVVRFVRADLAAPHAAFRRLCGRLPDNYVLHLRRRAELFA